MSNWVWLYQKDDGILLFLLSSFFSPLSSLLFLTLFPSLLAISFITMPGSQWLEKVDCLTWADGYPTLEQESRACSVYLFSILGVALGP
jgi:hypothetical protein